MSGQDRRDLLDIIAPPDAAEQQYRGSKDRRCTCHSTGDSGFSGSVQPDDINETARIFDGRYRFALGFLPDLKVSVSYFQGVY